jgi:predicted dinucleotide-binding enzyme
MQKVNVGILGSGDVGKAFARAFAAVGHNVKIGSRSPEKLDVFVAEAGERVTSGTFEETARFGDLIVFATLGVATEEAIRLSKPDNFARKVVIDATNPLDFSHGAPRLSIGHTDSLGEQVQRALPDARVVKAFNTVGNPLFFRPQLPGGPPDMFIAGNDADAKKIVAQVCDAFGWGVIDLGGIESSRHLEPMCMVWVLHGVLSGGWNHAFKLLHAPRA